MAARESLAGAFQDLVRFLERERIVYDVEANFPTPEDLILLKLVPGREKDLLDAKTVLARHRGHLDRPYLERWAQRLSDEAEDNRVWRTLQRLFTETEAAG